MATTLVKNATVLPFTSLPDGDLDLEPIVQDLFVEGDRITHIGLGIQLQADHVIDATDQLLIPGFVDAHTHSSLVVDKAKHEAMPLETWMLYIGPLAQLDTRLYYLCAAFLGMDAVKHGTTTIQDDLYAVPYVNSEIYAAAAQAYLDIGVRTNLSFGIINKPLHETVPFFGDYLPADMRQELEKMEGMLSDDEWIALFREMHGEWHGKDGLLQMILSPSASQRVTPDMMKRLGSLSEEYDVGIHTHLLETRTQAITGPEWYGESVLAYAKRHGILSHRTTIAHGIWLTPDDMELTASVGASIVHNVTSNYRLCSGIAAVRELLDAGVNVAIGSDGTDTFNLFNVIRMAGMVHSVHHPDNEYYPRAKDVLKWATHGGARATLLQDQIGSIEVGRKADFVLYNLNSVAFTPLNNIVTQLVYAEDGQSITGVFVNGQQVVKNGQLTRVNEADLLAELRDRFKYYQKQRQEWDLWADRAFPAMDKAVRKAMATPFEVNRFSKDERFWPTPVQQRVAR